MSILLCCVIEYEMSIVEKLSGEEIKTFPSRFTFSNIYRRCCRIDNISYNIYNNIVGFAHIRIKI